MLSLGIVREERIETGVRRPPLRQQLRKWGIYFWLSFFYLFWPRSEFLGSSAGL